jgi:hypothetical protein
MTIRLLTIPLKSANFLVNETSIKLGSDRVIMAIYLLAMLKFDKDFCFFVGP